MFCVGIFLVILLFSSGIIQHLSAHWRNTSYYHHWSGIGDYVVQWLFGQMDINKMRSVYCVAGRIGAIGGIFLIAVFYGRENWPWR